jgi:adenine-specific DNA-methyltransferase
MTRKKKLELTWIGKENRPKLEPRILLEDSTKSYHAKQRVTENDIFDNRLIFGDNLLALKALEQEFAGKVKCVFIDPPYNTGSAFTHYDDGVEHSVWLSLMRDRLEIIRRLLSDDGSLWITIDDNECHYLKVLCDEMFGRGNFVISVAWQKVFAKKNKALISGSHDHLLVIAKDISRWNRNLLPRNEARLTAFKNSDNDERGLWQSVAYSVQSEDAERRKAYRYPIDLPSGRKVMPPTGRHWNGLPDRTRDLKDDNRLWFGKNGDNPPRLKVFLSEVQQGIVPDTWWSHGDAGSNQDSKKEMLLLFPDAEPFSTPKPEKLLYRILTIATNPGDLVLDSFAGSGTTGAVAQKMGRRWIMVELGEHCHTHIIPRLKKVIDGEDTGGITKAVDWKGGGGFRYYRLAPSLLEKDKWGNWVINRDYNAAMLAEALCKLEGFSYAPSDSVYWQHGYSTEHDFIYVTTASLTHEQLQQLSDEVGPDRSLLVLCTAFRARADRYENLTVRKIPKQVLSRCEWGHDDYSLQVENLPKVPPAEVSAATGAGLNGSPDEPGFQGGLFGDERT